MPSWANQGDMLASSARDAASSRPCGSRSMTWSVPTRPWPGGVKGQASPRAGRARCRRGPGGPGGGVGVGKYDMVGADVPLAGGDECPGQSLRGLALLLPVPGGPGDAPVFIGQAQRPGQRALVRGREAGFPARYGPVWLRAEPGQQPLQMGQGQVLQTVPAAFAGARGVGDEHMGAVRHRGILRDATIGPGLQRAGPVFSTMQIPSIPYELALGWRYPRAGRATRRNGFISFISGVSMLGIALGVAALIIVLSVMNGFQKDVRD